MATNRKKAQTWVLIVALALGFLAGYLVARARYTNQIGIISKMVMERSTKIDNLNEKLNRLTMTEDRRMVKVEDGLISPLTQSITFANGTTVMTNGRVIDKDGEITTLEPGDSVDMDGNLLLQDDSMMMEEK